MSRMNNKNKTEHHITNPKRRFNLAHIDGSEISEEYGILDEEEKFLRDMKDQVVPNGNVDSMIKLLCRFHVCGVSSTLRHFEDIVRGEKKPTEYMVELNDFGGYGSGDGYSDFCDAMHFDLACKLIQRLQDEDEVKYSEILDCMVY